MNDTLDPKEKTLRDRFPIYCAACQEKITGNDYRIVGISLAKWVEHGGPGELPENISKHRGCIPAA